MKGMVASFDGEPLASLWWQVEDRRNNELANSTYDTVYNGVAPHGQSRKAHQSGEDQGLPLPWRWRRYGLYAETCIISREAQVGSSTWFKTKQAPYDLAVCGVFILAETIAPGWLEVNSGGSDADWSPALRWVEQTLGSERGYHLPNTIEPEDGDHRAAHLAMQYLLGELRLPSRTHQPDESFLIQQLQLGLKALLRARFGSLSPELDQAIEQAPRVTLEQTLVATGHEALDRISTYLDVERGG